MAGRSDMRTLKKLPDRPSVLLVGIPGPSLIGTLSISYLVHALNMEIIGEIENPEATPVVFIDEGEIFGPIRIYKSGSIFAVLSDLPIDYDMAVSFADSLIEFAQKNKIDMIVMPNGIQSAGKAQDGVKTYGLSTDVILDSTMYENAIPKFLTGMIAGPDAAILTRLRNSSVPSLILLTQCNFFFPDPESAMHSINTIASIVKQKIDLTEFKNQMNYLRLQGRQLMENTLNVLKQDKEPQAPPQIYK